MHDRAHAALRPNTTVRGLALTGALTATIGLSTAPPAQARERSSMDATERAVLKAINRVRASQKLARLRASRSLSRSADYHCSDMLRRDFFAHSSSNGTPFGTRVRRFSRGPARLGENLAWVGGDARRGLAGRVVSMWLRSPGHRAMILSPGFRSLGVARRTGTLGEVRAVVFTADFSSRR